ERIGLVIASERFAERTGGFWQQAFAHLSRCGVRLTFALGFELLTPRITAFLAWPLRTLLGRRLAFHPLPEHARRVGASYLSTGDINGPEALAALERFRP